MKGLYFILITAICFSFAGSAPVSRRWERQGELVNPLDFKPEVLKLAIIDFINYKRNRLHRKEVVLDPKLDSIVHHFNTEYSKKDLGKKRIKLKKGFYNKAKDYGYVFSWFKPMTTGYSIMPTNGRKVFLKDDEGKYYFGTGEVLNSPNQKLIQVPLLTYRELAKRLLYKSKPTSNKRWIGVSDVTLIGLEILEVDGTESNKIPYVKVLLVLSGKVMPAKL